MLDRRGFFKTLGLIAGGIIAGPQIFLPKFEPVIWKPLRPWNWMEYYAFLLDRTPHWADDVLRYWSPTDGRWIGQVSTAPWGAFSTSEQGLDCSHMQAPDLSDGWSVMETSGLLIPTGDRPTFSQRIRRFLHVDELAT